MIILVLIFGDGAFRKLFIVESNVYSCSVQCVHK